MPISSLSREFVREIKENYPEIRSLNLARNEIAEINSLESLASHLVSLDLSWNRITEVGFGLLCLVHLKQLVLAHNEISQLHNTNFTSLKCLVRLDLSNNLLQDRVSTITAFETLDSLVDLNLTENAADTNTWVDSVRERLPQLHVYNFERLLPEGSASSLPPLIASSTAVALHGTTRSTNAGAISSSHQMHNAVTSTTTTCRAAQLALQLPPRTSPSQMLREQSNTASSSGSASSSRKPALAGLKYYGAPVHQPAGSYTTSCGGGNLTSTSEEETMDQMIGMRKEKLKEQQGVTSSLAQMSEQAEEELQQGTSSEQRGAANAIENTSSSIPGAAATNKTLKANPIPNPELVRGGWETFGGSKASTSRLIAAEEEQAVTSSHQVLRDQEPFAIYHTGSGSGSGGASASTKILPSQMTSESSRNRFFSEDHFPTASGYSGKLAQLSGPGPSASSSSTAFRSQPLYRPTPNENNLEHDPNFYDENRHLRILVEPCPSPLEQQQQQSSDPRVARTSKREQALHQMTEQNSPSSTAALATFTTTKKEEVAFEQVLEVHQWAMTVLDDLDARVARGEDRHAVWREAVWTLAVEKRCLELEAEKQIQDVLAVAASMSMSATAQPDAQPLSTSTGKKYMKGVTEGENTGDHDAQDQQLDEHDPGIHDEAQDSRLHSKKRANSRRPSNALSAASGLLNKSDVVGPALSTTVAAQTQTVEVDHDNELQDELLAGQKSSRRGSRVLAQSVSATVNIANGGCMNDHNDHQDKDVELQESLIYRRKRTRTNSKHKPPAMPHTAAGVGPGGVVALAALSGARTPATAQQNVLDKSSSSTSGLFGKQYQFDEKDLLQFVDDKLQDQLEVAQNTWNSGKLDLFAAFDKCLNFSIRGRLDAQAEKLQKLETQVLEATLLLQAKNSGFNLMSLGVAGGEQQNEGKSALIPLSSSSSSSSVMQQNERNPRLVPDEQLQLHACVTRLRAEKQDLQHRLSQALQDLEKHQSSSTAAIVVPKNDDLPPPPPLPERRTSELDWKRKFLAAQEQLERYEKQADAAWKRLEATPTGGTSLDFRGGDGEEEKGEGGQLLTTPAKINPASSATSGAVANTKDDPAGAAHPSSNTPSLTGTSDLVSLFRGLQKLDVGRLNLPPRPL
ncbi:unnamed protein product [Amoebophrya sp. A120]|nr:unnamed protein product [Amoebophrya sp. A120]|eukprot:GSA120T00024644001.1